MGAGPVANPPRPQAKRPPVDQGLTPAKRPVAPQNAAGRADTKRVVPQQVRDGFDTKPQEQSTSIAPELLSIVRKLGVEKTQKFVEFIGALTGESSASTKKLLGNLGRTSSGMVTVEKLMSSYQEAARGNYVGSAASLAEAVGAGWNVLPDATRGRMASKVARSVAGTKLGPFADVMARMDSGSGMKAVSAVMRGRGDEFASAMKDVVKSLVKNPGLAQKVAPKLVKAMADLLPEHIRGEAMAKVAGRKVPVLGTAAVAIMDGVGIAKKPTDWKSWAGLGSTLAGLFPGAGTAASVFIDIAILGGEVVETVGELKGSLKARNPATS